MTTPAAVQGDYANHKPRYQRGLSLAERIWNGCVPVTECGCWIWMGAGIRYGHLRVDGRLVKAHRASWEAFVGPIPAGMHVLHRCDVGFCVNPAHLFLGTHADNMADKERKGRGNHATGLRCGPYTKPWRVCRGDRHPARINPAMRQGTKNGRSKLTEEQVLTIRDSAGPAAALGRQYGVSKTAIRLIRNGRNWRHL